MSHYSENIIIGAGAAGLFCAAQLESWATKPPFLITVRKLAEKF